MYGVARVLSPTRRRVSQLSGLDGDSGGAFARGNRNRRYALIAVAVGAPFFRPIVGLGTVLGVVPMAVHHLLARGLDFAIAALVLSAVYRSGPRSSESGLG